MQHVYAALLRVKKLGPAKIFLRRMFDDPQELVSPSPTQPPPQHNKKFSLPSSSSFPHLIARRRSSVSNGNAYVYRQKTVVVAYKSADAIVVQKEWVSTNRGGSTVLLVLLFLLVVFFCVWSFIHTFTQAYGGNKI